MRYCLNSTCGPGHFLYLMRLFIYCNSKHFTMVSTYVEVYSSLYYDLDGAVTTRFMIYR